MSDDRPEDLTAPERRRMSWAGTVAALSGVAAGELMSAVDTSGPSPLSAVGDAFIDAIDRDALAETSIAA
ncbi:MAG: hypothetical protein VW396_07620, partial [Ilumatobacter sp.]